MLVVVVCMRYRGDKVTREVLANMPRHVGMLVCKPNSGRITGEPYLRAELMVNGRHHRDLSPLEKATIRKVVDGNMLIVGTEQFKLGKREYVDLPQAWWCQLVPKELLT